EPRDPGHPHPPGLPGHLRAVRRGRVRGYGPEKLRQREKGLRRPLQGSGYQADPAYRGVCCPAEEVSFWGCFAAPAVWRQGSALRGGFLSARAERNQRTAKGEPQIECGFAPSDMLAPPWTPIYGAANSRSYER